jgi:hypothetical protein
LKFLCPACERLTAFSGFRADGDLLVLRCSRCGVESRSRASVAEAPGAVVTVGWSGASAAPAFGLKAVPSPPPAGEPVVVNGDAWSVPEGYCPKCIAVRPPEATTCSQCGLLFANFQPEELAPPPGIADQFQRLLTTWEDIEAHDRLLQAALIQGELAAVGRLYRIRLARAPQDGYAARGRDEVLRLATASSTGLAKADSTEEPHALGVWKYALLFAILAVCAIAFWVLFRQLRTVTS